MNVPTCWTRTEIRQQPRTLHATQAILSAQAEALAAFLDPLLARPEQRIILTGAGTSAFIGEALAPWLSRALRRTVEAIPTTDLVGCPDLHLRRDVPTLLVSFGRSGNSPESLAAMQEANGRVADAHHLCITCNADGALARATGPRTHVVLLPPETHDRAFAMTSSFSAMTLAALSIFTGVGAMDARIDTIVDAVADALKQGSEWAEGLATRRFSRVVYLGSGVFSGLAREAALKLLELSDGGLPSLFDTPLGFRHGPKTFIDPGTLVVIFLSNNPATRAYDDDLVAELRADRRAAAVLTIGAADRAEDHLQIAHAADLKDAELLFPFIVPAQLFALAISETSGLSPDQPNAAGQVNRVVQGVRIHTLAA